MAIVLALLDNPAVLNFLATLLLAGFGWLGAKLAKVIDLNWASGFLMATGGLIDLSLRAGVDEYIARIDAADDDGVVTAEERAMARKAAINAALDELGLAKLAKAITIASGQKAGLSAAQTFIERGIDARLRDLGLGAQPSEDRPLDGDASA